MFQSINKSSIILNIRKSLFGIGFNEYNAVKFSCCHATQSPTSLLFNRHCHHQQQEPNKRFQCQRFPFNKHIHSSVGCHGPAQRIQFRSHLHTAVHVCCVARPMQQHSRHLHCLQQQTQTLQPKLKRSSQYYSALHRLRVTHVLCCDLATRNLSTSPQLNMNQLQEEKSKFTPPTHLGVKVAPDEVQRFMLACMKAVGTEETMARQLTDVLVAADTRGIFSHGLNRLEMYVNDVRTKNCNGNATPSIEKQSVSTALVNGNNGLGPVVGNFSMDLAIAKAKETGIGWVCARGSNHYGIAGWYAMRATAQGLLGMSFTNTSPLVAPTRAKAPALGTNPLSLAAPAKKDEPFVLDMATCTVAVGKIEVCRRKEEPIPEGWALDKSGRLTTSAAEAMSGALMPLGGIEQNSGYKGYGLAMMVEIFCGILSGAHYGPNVRRWMDTTREADLGQCFMAIDPSFFAPGFETRMVDLMDHCKNMDPAEADKPVLVAGDPERAHCAKVAAEGGITYHINQLMDSWKLAQVLKVEPMAGV